MMHSGRGQDLPMSAHSGHGRQTEKSQTWGYGSASAHHTCTPSSPSDTRMHTTIDLVLQVLQPDSSIRSDAPICRSNAHLLYAGYHPSVHLPHHHLTVYCLFFYKLLVRQIRDYHDQLAPFDRLPTVKRSSPVPTI